MWRMKEKFTLELLGGCVLNLCAGESPHRARFPCDERQMSALKGSLETTWSKPPLLQRRNGIQDWQGLAPATQLVINSSNFQVCAQSIVLTSRG